MDLAGQDTMIVCDAPGQSFVQPPPLVRNLVTCPQSCPNRGSLDTCCCMRGVRMAIFRYLGCSSEPATHNAGDAMILHDWKGRIFKLETPPGRYVHNTYAICRGGDCGAFDFSCEQPLQDGMRSGNWKVRSKLLAIASSSRSHACQIYSCQVDMLCTCLLQLYMMARGK